VRWAVLYRDKSAFLIGGASRSSAGGVPLEDGIFMGSIQTLRHLKPAEYPLAQPYRLKIVTASATTKIEDYIKNLPGEQFRKEELELLNGLYPKRAPRAGDPLKVVE
jgi:predicted Zn-dependent protease